MKSLQKIITVTLLLFALTITQQAQAQTKEETIAWIKEKLEKHGGYKGENLKDVQVSPCNISFIKEKEYDSSYFSFNPTESKTWTGLFDSDSGEHSLCAGANIIRMDTGVGSYQLGCFAIKNNESDIHERMAKALLHLATFCEQKKEAF